MLLSLDFDMYAGRSRLVANGDGIVYEPLLQLQPPLALEPPFPVRYGTVCQQCPVLVLCSSSPTIAAVSIRTRALHTRNKRSPRYRQHLLVFC